MEYLNPALETREILLMLQNKNLIIEDVEEAVKFLENVSYFRFSDYLKPFEVEEKKRYKEQTTFLMTKNLYDFDAELRGLLFNAIQRIEVSLRAKVSNYFSLRHGPFWFLEPSLAIDKHRYTENLSILEKELQRTKAEFLKEHIQKYGKEDFPPSWKIIDLTTFGSLTKLYFNFTDSSIKKQIAASYGIPHQEIFKSWMKTANELRNICAHHGRIWNRTFPMMPILPSFLPNPWISEKPKINNKLYAVLCCLIYWLKAIDPKHPIVEDFKRLLVRYPMIDPFAMGFPKNWKEQCIFDE